MVRFGICTSDQVVGEQIQARLHQWADIMCLKLETTQWGRPEELLRGTEDYTILFLDAGCWGTEPFDLIERLKALYPRAELVLFSADPQIAIDSYHLHPAGFLRVPVQYQPLARTLERCPQSWRAGVQWLEAPSNRSVVRIPQCEVFYAEASGRNCILHGAEGTVQLSRSLRWVEELLACTPFLRCQKSFIVNLCAVKDCTGNELVMSDGTVISVGRGQRKEVQLRYGAFRRLTEQEE